MYQLYTGYLSESNLGVGRYDISYRKRCIVFRIENIDMKEFHIVIVSKVSKYRI